jgi:3-hydroxyisobutyrate dehydrogenase
LKLAANSWVGTIVAATAQAIALARGLGPDPQVFLDTVQGGAVDTPCLHVKGQAMIAGQFPPAFTLDGAVKDTGLIAAAMRETGTDATLMDAVAQIPRDLDDGPAGSAVLRARRNAHVGRRDQRGGGV